MELTITNDDYKVLSSKSILMKSKDSKLNLYFKATEKFSFTLTLCFQSTTDKTVSVSKKFEEPSTIILECINFNSPLGSGTIEPINIATVEGHKWYFHFWSYLMGDNKSTRKVEYTLFEQVNVENA